MCALGNKTFYNSGPVIVIIHLQVIWTVRFEVVKSNPHGGSANINLVSVTRLMSLVLAVCSSISIRGQWSFNQIIQPECCISKPCLWSCNEVTVAHAPVMACHVCASVAAQSIQFGWDTGKYELIPTTIIHILTYMCQLCTNTYTGVS